MKLLEKKEIDRAKALDKRNEIDQGKALAKKVDDLRELTAKEQANLSKFRNESLQKIKEEIDTAISEREEVRRDIAELELKKKLIDTPELTEWDRVKGHSERMEEELALFNKRQDLKDKEAEIEKRYTALTLEESRIADERKRSLEYLEESKKVKDNAEKVLFENVEKGNRLAQDWQQKEKAIELREKEIAIQQVDLFSKLEQVEKDKQEIINEKVRLKDQRETLERAFARLKK